MPRFKLTIEYAGTRYSGWQIQKNARTVQGEIDRAAREVTGARDLELYGAGRTDAGVHALAQVAHLDVRTSLPPETLRRRINEELPADINILAIESVPHRFHARHDAVSRTYLYQVARRRTAFAKPYVWWVRDELDLDRMRRVAAALRGFNDFASFTDDDPDEKSTDVAVSRLDVLEAGALVLVRIEGSHFLWKMVRRVVGVLVNVGIGNLAPGEVEQFLRRRSELPARLTAPASGLFLERVTYRADRPAADPPPFLTLR
jgi:tRNA pseudouridine38-40 synthase